LPAPALFETRFAAADKDYRLFVPAAALAGIERPQAAFFPLSGSLIDNAAAPELRRQEGGIELTLARPAPAGAVPGTLDGVLALTGTGGSARAFAISANPTPPAPVGGMPWGEALLLAFLGGVILNAMPCVFPILSLKLLGLARQAHGHRAEQLWHGAAYTAGVVASFAALGGALLLLRAGGQALGWGFQLQSPILVAVLAYVLLAMGLSLSGVVTFGEELAGAGGRFAERGGTAGAFFTGVLATVVATPCTAPFMGAAMGLALVAPAPLAIGIFVAVGLGLAAPYLLATIVPGWQHVLPRPGAWMELAKQLLAFPLYGTVAWLVWVLMQEVGPQGSLAALFGLVLVGFAAWIYGRTRLAAPLGRRLGLGLAVGGTAAAVLLAASLSSAVGAAASAPARDGIAYQAFSPERLAALKAEGEPVFVNLTAAWCITCIVNERLVLDGAAIREAFAARGVAALKGNWTRQDPAITSLLQEFGRSGVPLYLLYDRRS
jgi:thiol:disulfide interchange protein